jgi:cell division protein FtsA
VTSEAIRESLYAVRSKTDLPVTSAYIGITGSHVSFDNKVDYFESVGAKGVITEEEVGKIPGMVTSAAESFGREVIHALPKTYGVDGHNGINNPTGMHAYGLEVKSHIVTAGSSFVKDLERAATSAGVRVKGMVLEPLASSEAILTQKEKNRGASIVDIGGGTTDIVSFKKGTIDYTSVIPVGGFQFTNDIAITYNTTYHDAEQAKLKYANTEPASVDMREELSLPVVNSNSVANVYRRDLCQLMRERTLELIRLIDLKLQEAGVRQDSSAQVVMTGGASTMPGFFEMVEQYIPNCSIRMGAPNHLSGMATELEAPAYSTGVGILLYGFRQEIAADRAVVNHVRGTSGRDGRSLMSRIKEFFNS